MLGVPQEKGETAQDIDQYRRPHQKQVELSNEPSKGSDRAGAVLYRVFDLELCVDDFKRELQQGRISQKNPGFLIHAFEPFNKI